MILFFFNDTATTEIYTLSLHRRSSDLLSDRNRALIVRRLYAPGRRARLGRQRRFPWLASSRPIQRSCHPNSRSGSTSSNGRDRKSTRLNSSPRQYLVCRLLLEKKKTTP